MNVTSGPTGVEPPGGRRDPDGPPRDEDPIAGLQRELRDFAAERDWEPFHTPRNLSALIASEAGELLALFRWGQDAVRESPDEVRMELADVFLGVLRLADVAGIDLVEAAREKIRRNAERFSVDRAGHPDG